MGINWEQNGIILSSAFKLLYSLTTSGIPTFLSCHLGYLNTFTPSFSAAWAKGSAFPYKKHSALPEKFKRLNVLCIYKHEKLKKRKISCFKIFLWKPVKFHLSLDVLNISSILTLFRTVGGRGAKSLPNSFSL